MNYKKPTVIQFPINNICNSRCQMCDIWKQKKDYELAPNDIYNILSDSLFDKVTGIGLNGGEPTLRHDLADVGNSVIDALPNLKNISLITNGLAEKVVKKRVTELYEVCRSKGVHLDIMLSVDGVYETHDIVRGRPNNFEHTVNCLHYFRNNKIGDSYRLGCTLISSNIEDAERLMLWSEQNQIYTRFRVGIPHKRLYSVDKTDPFVLSKKQRFHLCNFIETLISRYETDFSRKIYLSNLLKQIAYNAPRVNGCYWKDQGVTLLSDGNLAYCAVESPNIGDLTDTKSTPLEIYSHNTSIRDSIIRNKCDTCIHDYEGPFTRKRDKLKLKIENYKETNPKLYAKIIKAKYLVSHAKERTTVLRSKASSLLSSNSTNRLGDKVLILGWYGTETLGDKAILYSIIEAILDKNISAENIYVASINQYVTSFTLSENPATENCNSISLDDAWKLINSSSCRCVVFGGGPLMTSINYMVDYAAMFVKAKTTGSKCFLWGTGIGPVNSNKVEDVRIEALKLLLTTSDLAIFRDKPSLDHALKLVPTLSRSKLSYGLDPAYHWIRKVAFKENISNQILDSFSDQKSSVAFAIRELPIREYYTNSNDANSLQNKFNESIKRVIIEQTSYSDVYLQCMHRLPCGGDDRLFYNDLLGDQISSDKVYFSFKHRNPIEDVKSLSRQEALFAMRYHSIVFGLALRIPIIPIDYTSGGKIAYLCNGIGIKPFSIEKFVEICAYNNTQDLVNTLAFKPSTYEININHMEGKSSANYEKFASRFAGYYFL